MQKVLESFIYWGYNIGVEVKEEQKLWKLTTLNLKDKDGR